MIQFTCRCSHVFNVDDDMAAMTVQCPECRRLNDVPTLTDLANLDEGGAYKMAEDAKLVEPERLNQLQRAFRKERVDETGEEIDLRETAEDILRAGVQEVPQGAPDQVIPGAPKYDPETGELIRPMDVQPFQPASEQTIPMAKPALQYASGPMEHVVSAIRIPLELLMPANAIVLFFVLLGHVLFVMILFPVLAGFFIAAPILILAALGIISHYGNIIDETGPQEKDEVPRPLRQLSWHDDLWGPFVGIAGALLLSYALAVLALRLVEVSMVLGQGSAIALGAVGTIVFPAVLLSMITSGTIQNLRPDRVLEVIRICGVSYVFAVIGWIATVIVYVAGCIGLVLHGISLFQSMSPGFLATVAHPAIVYPTLAVGIYLAHLFCWYLGLLYRAHHEQFPWVLQRHIHVASKKEQILMQANRSRRGGAPMQKESGKTVTVKHWLWP